MGAKKPTPAASRQARGVVRRMKTRLVSTPKTPQSQLATKSRSTPSKLEKLAPNVAVATTAGKKTEGKESQQSKQPTAQKASNTSCVSKITKKETLQTSSPGPSSCTAVTQAKITSSVTQSSTATRSSSAPSTPKRGQLIQQSPILQEEKPDEDKAKAINKMLKSLDIKISGFTNILPDEQKSVDCKASISEIVKTKSRAAAAKVGSSGMLPKVSKKACIGGSGGGGGGSGQKDSVGGKKTLIVGKIVEKNKSAEEKTSDDCRKSTERKDDASAVCQKTKDTKSKEVLEEIPNEDKVKVKEKAESSNSRNQSVKKTEGKLQNSSDQLTPIKSKENVDDDVLKGKGEDSNEGSNIQDLPLQTHSEIALSDTQPVDNSNKKSKGKDVKIEYCKEVKKVTAKQAKKGKKTPDKKGGKSGGNKGTQKTDSVLEKIEEKNSSSKAEKNSSNFSKKIESENSTQIAGKMDEKPCETEGEGIGTERISQLCKNTATKRIVNKVKNPSKSSIKEETTKQGIEDRKDEKVMVKDSNKTAILDHSEDEIKMIERIEVTKTSEQDIHRTVSLDSGGNIKRGKPKSKTVCNDGPSPPENSASRILENESKKSIEIKDNIATLKVNEKTPTKETTKLTVEHPMPDEKSQGTGNIFVSEKTSATEKFKDTEGATTLEEQFLSKERSSAEKVIGHRYPVENFSENVSQEEKLNSQNSKVDKKENMSKILDQKKVSHPSDRNDAPSPVTLPKVVSPKSPSFLLTEDSKLLSVRERLQKKYVQNRAMATGFRSFKLNKQTKPTKKSVTMKPQKSSSKSKCSKDKQVEEPNPEKKEKDIYDFKTESESDDNIKMNLLGQSSILSKILLEKDFSDEDDKPLQLTKLKLKEEKEERAIKNLDENQENKKSQKPEVNEVKKEDKKSAGPAKKPIGPAKKPVVKQTGKQPARQTKKTVAAKRKERANSNISSSSESESESDESTSSDSRLRKSCFGPKRHRMASLNALAKVQCLYENESRTAHELGLSKSAQIPRMRVINSGSSSDEEKDTVKKESEMKDVKKEVSTVVAVNENKRELRNAPGLRGIGKHWEFNDVSSFESGHESDVTFRGRIDFKPKSKKRKPAKPKVTAVKDKDKDKEKPEPKPKKAAAKTQKKKPPPQRRSSSDTSDDEEDTIKASHEDSQANKKRKRDNKMDDITGTGGKEVLARKRMAGLNASALVAATYEVERHLDRNLNSDCSSFESFPEYEKPIVYNPPKKLKDIKKDKSEEASNSGKESKENSNKDGSRPTSSSVVIVQDTDVTITGVYVNSSAGSSQEAYCKMQYRVQSSVTEERVIRPNSIDPPKSYTPLGALSSMRPPGAAVPPEGQQQLPTSQQQQQPQQSQQQHHHLQQQSAIQSSPAANIYPSPTISQESPQPNPHIYPPPHQHPTSPMAVSHQHQPEQQHPPPSLHHHHHPQQQMKYPPPHLSHHHHHQQQPHQPTPLIQSRCESPIRYQSSAYQSVQPPHPPSSLTMPGSGSSAFCAPMQQSHHDMSGYYQPAGPLISPHVLPSVPQSNAALVSTKQVPSPLDSDPDQLQQPPPSTSAAESSDSEVLITGGDLTTFRYPSQQQQQQHQQQQQQQSAQSQQLSVLSSQQQSQQGSPYSRSMHQMHYPPAYPPSYYSPYPGDAMCYSPPYQPYFPAKVYQSAPAYRRYPTYYQPGHPQPSDLYDPPPPSSAGPPPPTGSQLVPTGPTAPQHMEHYPGPPGFYSGYSPGGGQCYTRGMQPPYMEYPPQCPCPMQSCPKNVLTGPLIGSNSSGNNSSTNSSSSASISMSTNNNNNNNSSSTNSISSNNNTTNNSLSSLSQPLKASKGPVQQHPVKSHSHIMGTMESTNPLSNGAHHLGKSHLHRHHVHQCKMEHIEPLKSDLKTEINDPMISSDNTKSSQYEEVAVPPTPPSSYTVNDKLIEPEITVSPARGSTGLPTVPDQTDKAASIPSSIVINSPQPPMMATVPRESSNTVASTNLPPTIGRKARIGKSMAREMMYGAHALPHHHHHHQQHPQIYSHTLIHHHLPSHNPTPELVKVNPPLTESNGPVIQTDLGKIKKEEIKNEEEDVVLILDDEKKIKTEPDVVEVFDDKTDSASKESPACAEISDTEENGDIPRQQNSKRMKILELNKAQCKKSPQNGYKSLIKQADPKPYLCLSRKSDKKDRFAKMTFKGGVRKRKLMLTEQQKKRLIMRKRKLIQERQKQKAERAARNKLSASKSSVTVGSSLRRAGKQWKEQPEKSNKAASNRSTDLLPATPLVHTIDCVARGYFSEPEIRSSTGRKTKKTKSAEVRSKSETKKSLQQLELAKISPRIAATTSSKQQNSELQYRHKSKSKESSEKSSFAEENFSEEEEDRKRTKSSNPDGKKRKRDDSTGGKAKTNKRVKSSAAESPDVATISEDMSPSLAGGATTVNINNNILEASNKKFLEEVEEEEQSPAVTPTPSEEIVRPVYGYRQPTKRTRSRSKFGSRRRHKTRNSAINQAVDPIVIPRKLNVVPRWNNGWSWDGEPFQGKVFLNSDDPLVVRTCYPAMRHAEGDVIQPKDCVLLRAGAKKNELPYVAKVAHLWESPEDGEMMMSLLWYYRPEHTEQGRQPNDNPDEVFASRHRDHNSVACIEDKCYVLTFSEYCRYRRNVRSTEEEIDEEVSVVPSPSPSISFNFHQVPISTNPEQVLFCQRVYDFRLKRLMKTSSNN